MTVQEFPDVTIISHDEVLRLADKLYIRGISALVTCSAADRADLITASRVLRRMLAVYERQVGQQLHTIMLSPVVEVA